MKTVSLLMCVSLAWVAGLGCNRSVKIEDQTKKHSMSAPQTTAAAPATTQTTTAPPAAVAETPKTQTNTQPKETQPVDTNEVAVIKTSFGEMVIEFWPDVAPGTVENFKKLAREGFYDGTAFHRIIDGFMIQGGDPLTKDPKAEPRWGTGGPGYTIKGETNTRPDRRHERGVISMAHSGHPDTAGSQFFICLASLPQLDGNYTTFGRLIKGDDVLEKIAKVPVKPNPYDPRGEKSRPIQRVEIESIRIVPASQVK